MRTRSRWDALGAISIALVLAGCGSTAASSAGPSTSGVGSKTLRASASTVWLCRPGVSPDPCTTPMTTTVVSASGARSVERIVDDPRSPFDCFYVYPTVSTEPTNNSNLAIQGSEIGIAASQAAPFSQVCRVWAPMYRQRTEASLARGLGSSPGADEIAYRSLLSGWMDYLHHDNHGRPVIFIGHSQGAALLIRLLSSKIDHNAALRSRLVSAIILGGNVTVPDGRRVGATFARIPTCASTSETGCVIAYSTFPSQPPADSLFGRPGTGVSLQSNQRTRTGVHVACVNPAAIGGSTGVLSPSFLTVTQPVFAPPITTPWVTYPNRYSSTCRSQGGATWLQVSTTNLFGDVRPYVTELLGPTWGYHLDDVNLAVGNLVHDVHLEEASYDQSHS